METLTRELVEAHLMSCVEINSAVQGDGVRRWAWRLTPMAGRKYDHRADKEIKEMDRELGMKRNPPGVGAGYSYEYSSREAAINFAFGWIRRNRPDLERAATAEAREGIRYRAAGSA